MSLAPARKAALAVLRRVREREAFGPETLDAVLRASGLSAADVALATRLAYGTLETVGVLDEAIDARLEKPGRVEPAVRDALRMSAYELLYMRTPARAVVHEGVDAVRGVRRQAAGLANAVLRRVAESAADFPWGDPDSDDAALSRASGHPLWLTELLVHDLGRETAHEVLDASCEPAPLYVWANPFRGSFTEAMDALTADGAEPVADVPPGAIRAGRPHAAVSGAAVAVGRVVVCDAAAQIAALALDARPGQIVVDVASGRGTKTAQIQAHAVAHGGPCRLFALDVHPFKAEVLARRMRDLAVPDVTALVGDAVDLASVAGLPEAGSVDAVLLDAPCSGLGTLRRHPEKRWRLDPSDPERLADLQLLLLSASASLVRVGGRVVYSTCSVSHAENEGVVAAFLRECEGRFAIVGLGDIVPVEWSRFLTDEGFFRSVPLRDGPDGHFVAAFERVG